MQDAIAYWAETIGAAFLSSPLGASELLVGLLVATTFVAFAAKSLIPGHADHAWSRHEASRRS
jgi:hypothetical protein